MTRRILTVFAIAAVALVTFNLPAWATPKANIAAKTSVVDGRGVVLFHTANGKPLAHDTIVHAVSYTLPAASDGKWNETSSPQTLFDSIVGTFPKGETQFELTVALPTCLPFQLDAGLGAKIQQTVTYPQGSKRNVNGKIYPKQGECHTTPPSPGPSNNTSTPPSPSAHSTKYTATPQPTLAATGDLSTPWVALAAILALIVGTGCLFFARRPRKH